MNLHTGIQSSPKHAMLSDAAFRLWTHALCWSKEHLTDGFLPSKMLPTFHPKAAKHAPELLREVLPGTGPLWHAVEGGYAIHDYAQWQETKDRVQERRQSWRDRQSKKRDGVTPIVTAGVTRDSRECHADSPSDGSGGGRGSKTHTEPTAVVVPFDDKYGASPAQKHSPAHAWRSTIGKHIPHFLHTEFTDSVANAGDKSADASLRTWYANTEAEWRGKKCGDDAIVFWRARFKEWQGTSVKGRPTEPANPAQDRNILDLMKAYRKEEPA